MPACSGGVSSTDPTPPRDGSSNGNSSGTSGGTSGSSSAARAPHGRERRVPSCVHHGRRLRRRLHRQHVRDLQLREQRHREERSGRVSEAVLQRRAGRNCPSGGAAVGDCTGLVWRSRSAGAAKTIPYTSGAATHPRGTSTTAPLTAATARQRTADARCIVRIRWAARRQACAHTHGNERVTRRPHQEPMELRARLDGASGCITRDVSVYQRTAWFELSQVFERLEVADAAVATSAWHSRCSSSSRH